MNVGVYILKRYTMNSKATSKQSLKKKQKFYLISQEDKLNNVKRYKKRQKNKEEKQMEK